MSTSAQPRSDGPERQESRPFVLWPNQTMRVQDEAQRYRTSSAGGAMAAPRVGVLSLWAGRILDTSLLLLGRRVPRVPKHFELRRMWEEVIRLDHEHMAAGELRALADEAMDAQRLVEHWLTPRGQQLDPRGQDGRWVHWYEQIQAQMRASGLLTQSGQLRWLAGLISDQGALPTTIPAVIELRGFLALTPLERQFLDALESLGSEVIVARPGLADDAHREETPSVRVFDSLTTEIHAAAIWARDQSAPGDRHIAVLVNGLPGVLPQVQRQFERVFDAPGRLGLAGQQDSQFHIPAGTSLIEQPVVDAALSLISLSLSGPRSELSFFELSRWLLSVFWQGAATEKAPRSALELALRINGTYRTSLAQLACLPQAVEAPVLTDCVARLPSAVASASPAQQFFAWLVHWGWPGPLLAASVVRRAVERFRMLLEELEFSETHDLHEAFGLLKQRCAEVRLVQHGGALSPVQILSPEDACGLSFDAVRVINVHSENWPPPARLNRLLPFHLSKLLPQGSIAEQLGHTMKLQGAIQRLAPEVIFSRAETVDHLPVANSPLMAPPGSLLGAAEVALAASDWLGAAWPGVIKEASSARPTLIPVACQKGVALPASRDTLAGVVSLLDMQAACPWAAYLAYRLKVVFPEVPQAFSGPQLVGQLLHRALEWLYEPHLNSGTLPSSSEIGPVLERLFRSPDLEGQLGPAALKVEQNRLHSLINEWLVLESTLGYANPRALERTITAELNGFTLRLRIDRIDQVEGQGLIIDYKTGALGSEGWDQERLSAVQGPLYAVLLANAGEPIGGFALASLKSGEMKLRGVSGISSVGGRGWIRLTPKPSKTEHFVDWPGALEFWETQLCGLLEEYRQGQCEFQVHNPKVLQYSGLDLILRTDEGADDEQ